MTRTYPVTGIVLRHHALRESDKILVVLTREEGLKRVVAKGLRKAQNRIGGRLEPLRENQILLAKGRSMDVVTQVDSLRRFGAVMEDYDRLAAAFGAAEVLMAFLEEQDPLPEGYDLFVSLLENLTPGADPAVLLAVFELQLLAHLGYRPELAACMTCERAITAGEEVYGLNIEAGGAVCSHCVGLMSGEVRRLTPGGWRLLRHLQDTPLADCRGIRAPAPMLSNTRHVLKAYMGFRAERELKAQGMFDWLPAETPTPAG